MCQSWGAIVCITDSLITLYDVRTYEILCQLPETKGCTLFSVQQRNCTLAVVNKKKLSYYLWNASSLEFITDRALPDTPKLMHCLSQSVILGYRRHYEAVDIPSLTTGGPTAGPTIGAIGTYVRARTGLVRDVLVMITCPGRQQCDSSATAVRQQCDSRAEISVMLPVVRPIDRGL